MITFTKISEKKAKIVTKGVGALANGLRRVLLDEVETYCFNTTNCDMETNDCYLTFDLLRAISFVRFLDPFVVEDEKEEFFIKVTNNSKEPVSVLSTHICSKKTGKPINFVEYWEVCTLSPDCQLIVTNITLVKNIGRYNAKHSVVFGPVSYKPLDVKFIYYLNEKGKIEDNLRAIPTKAIKFVNEKDAEDLCLNYIVWNEDWSKKMNREDLELSKDLVKIDYSGNFCPTELYDSYDYEIVYNSNVPEKAFKEACKIIARDIQGDLESLTITAGEILRFFAFKQMECPIYGKFDQNNYKIKIEHVDEKKIVAEAIKEVISILKPHLN